MRKPLLQVIGLISTLAIVCVANIAYVDDAVAAKAEAEATNECNANGDKSNMNVDVTDVVMRINDTGGRYRILFETHSGVYYLSKSLNGSEDILKLLAQSQKSKRAVHACVNSDTMEIEKIN